MKRQFYLPLLIGLLIFTSLFYEAEGLGERKEKGMQEIREPAVSGMFYPDRPEILSRDVKKYLENAKREKIDGRS